MQSRFRILAAVFAAALFAMHAHTADAATAEEIERGANAALENLFATTPGARDLAEHARGVLIFPEIVKGGFIFAGQYGDGVLRKRGKTAGFYRSLAASYGFQAGIQTFGYVLFFMDDASLNYLNASQGWELGVGPSIVILDQGMAKNISTTTLQKGVYAFIFNQQGLMAGIGLQGSKITRIHPSY